MGNRAAILGFHPPGPFAQLNPRPNIDATCPLECALSASYPTDIVQSWRQAVSDALFRRYRAGYACDKALVVALARTYRGLCAVVACSNR
jgi:hypothetical protein